MSRPRSKPTELECERCGGDGKCFVSKDGKLLSIPCPNCEGTGGCVVSRPDVPVLVSLDRDTYERLNDLADVEDRTVAQQLAHLAREHVEDNEPVEEVSS